MTQSIEAKHTDKRKKDKFSAQIKEFRKDFQRVMLEVDLKQYSVQVKKIIE